MYVQDKQQGQGHAIDPVGTDAGLQAGGLPSGEQAADGAGGAEETATFKADIERALYLAAEMAGVNVRVLTSASRRERPCLMRQIAAYWLLTERGYNMREIGEAMHRDRTSVYHSANRIGGLLAIGDRLTRELWQVFNDRITDYEPIKTKTMGVLHDLEGMPDWQKKREYLARLLTNLTFEVADVLETLFVECQEANAECGYVLRQNEKRHFNAAMHHVKAFRSATRELDSEAQQSFGDDAEILLDLIYAAVTRTGTDDQMMHRFLNYIMSFPDRVGLDGVRKGGEQFEAIKMQQAKERIEKATRSDDTQA